MLVKLGNVWAHTQDVLMVWVEDAVTADDKDVWEVGVRVLLRDNVNKQGAPNDTVIVLGEYQTEWLATAAAEKVAEKINEAERSLFAAVRFTGVVV